MATNDTSTVGNGFGDHVMTVLVWVCRHSTDHPQGEGHVESGTLRYPFMRMPNHFASLLHFFSGRVCRYARPSITVPPSLPPYHLSSSVTSPTHLLRIRITTLPIYPSKYTSPSTQQ